MSASSKSPVSISVVRSGSFTNSIYVQTGFPLEPYNFAPTERALRARDGITHVNLENKHLFMVHASMMFNPCDIAAIIAHQLTQAGHKLDLTISGAPFTEAQLAEAINELEILHRRKALQGELDDHNREIRELTEAIDYAVEMQLTPWRRRRAAIKRKVKNLQKELDQLNG